VPGTVRCAATLLENWGTISLADALAPAIKAAREGIQVSSRLARDTDASKLKKDLGRPAYDVARAVFRPNDGPLEKDDLLVQ
jgi:gamma-glutamyltranspeptidase/glutathione hydrolase